MKKSEGKALAGSSMTAGEMIGLCRRARGWTKTRLAKESGISVTQLCNIENFKSEPTVRTFVVIIRALGFEMDVFDVALGSISSLEV